MKLMNVIEVGARVGLTQARIYERMRSKTFPAGQKIGMARMWNEEDINNWIEQNKNKND